jgi:hypothetical protein
VLVERHDYADEDGGASSQHFRQVRGDFGETNPHLKDDGLTGRKNRLLNP